ncbi:head-to-tail adaptor [Rhodococcus phage NiceHouse]|nr:head-to-tail adaptor [Rhodococcus phage NiceHouse]
MRELFSSEPNLVKLVTSVQGRPELPLAVPVVKLLAGNDKNALLEVAVLTANEVDNGEYEIPVPQHLLHQKRFAAMDITYELEEYGVIKQLKTYDVARRLLDFEELNALLGQGMGVDYKTFSFIETDVRKIIESYCNQSFNCWFGSQIVQGEAGNISLYENLEQLTSINVGSKLMANQWSPVEGFIISDSGKAIYNPERDRTVSFFHSKSAVTNYTVEGLWGYSSIPAGVHQAALELAKGFLCDDIEYRRRYIEAITNGDTRIQFSKQAYIDSTGNPIVDQILAPYRLFLFGAV